MIRDGCSILGYRLGAAMISALLCCAPMQPVAAETGPPVIPGPADPVANPTYHTALVSRLSLGDLVIELETTRLSDLIKRYPGSVLGHRGDAGGAEDWVCYTIDTAQGKILVWPSSGEMGGGDVVTGVAIAYAPGSGDKNCREIFTGSGQPKLDADVWLGLSKATVVKRIGPPSRAYGTVISYDFDFPLAGPNPHGCTVFGGMDLGIENGSVSKIWINKATSC